MWHVPVLHNDPVFITLLHFSYLVLFLPPSLLPLSFSTFIFFLLVSFPLLARFYLLCFSFISSYFCFISAQRHFAHPSAQPSAPPSPLYNVYCYIPGGEVAGAWCWSSTPSSAEVKEREKLLLLPRLSAFVVCFIVKFTFTFTIFLSFTHV